MPAWSLAQIRPKLDGFFANVRASLEARADAGVDRRRLEDFLAQTRTLQERLYTCLGSDDRSDLPAVLKDIQVLAYRTRVLFGSPLPGVVWDDLQTLLAGLPAAPSGPGRVLTASDRSAFVTGELSQARRDVNLPDRTLVATVPVFQSAEPAMREAPLGESVREADSPPSPIGTPHVEASAPDPAEPADPAPEGDVSPEAPPQPLEAAAPALAFLRFPMLIGVLVFLLGAIAGSVLGGTHPLLTALACGLLAVAATRRERGRDAV